MDPAVSIGSEEAIDLNPNDILGGLKVPQNVYVEPSLLDTHAQLPG